MAKQMIVELDKGATGIFQKDMKVNGYNICIVFIGGARLDGKYTGLTHFVEHSLFRSTSDNLTRDILNNILKYTINLDAFTTEDYVCVQFFVTPKNADVALDFLTDILNKDNFVESQIKKETAVISQEINMHKTNDKIQRPLNALDVYIDEISKSEPYSHADILGTPKTLAKITPEILKTYKNRYINTNNMIISVTSNKPTAEVIKLCNEKILAKLPEATDKRYIIPYPKEIEYDNKNMLVAIPNEYNPNVKLSLLFRENPKYINNPDKAYAYDVVEEYLMNGLGGMLYDTLRVGKSLVYSYGCENFELGAGTKFKSFTALTSPGKMNETIREICKMLNGITTNGVPKDKFETIKSVLIDEENSKLNKYRNCDCKSNFEDFIYNQPFIDYKEVNKYIENMTYEDFNTHLQEIIKDCNVSLLIDGKFDSRKCYNIVEIEEMLGNHSHSSQKFKLNSPRIEYTVPKNANEVSIEELLMSAIVGLQNGEENPDAQKYEETLPVDMNDEELETE